MKDFIRKIAFLIVEKTTDPIFDSQITAMHTFKGTLYVATKNGTLYEKNGNDWKIHRKLI